MRLANLQALVALIILLMISPAISACSNDDESQAPVETPTPTTIPTTIQTSSVDPAVTPTEPSTPQENIDVTIGVFSDITGMAASAMFRCRWRTIREDTRSTLRTCIIG